MPPSMEALRVHPFTALSLTMGTDLLALSSFSHAVVAPVAAILTEKIQSMLGHMQQHRKDFHSRRGLEGMLTKRRKALQYLRSRNFEAYSIVISKLGLKDSFAKQVCPGICISNA